MCWVWSRARNHLHRLHDLRLAHTGGDGSLTQRRDRIGGQERPIAISVRRLALKGKGEDGVAKGAVGQNRLIQGHTGHACTPLDDRPAVLDQNKGRRYVGELQDRHSYLCTLEQLARPVGAVRFQQRLGDTLNWRAMEPSVSPGLGR